MLIGYAELARQSDFIDVGIGVIEIDLKAGDTGRHFSACKSFFIHGLLLRARGAPVRVKLQPYYFALGLRLFIVRLCERNVKRLLHCSDVTGHCIAGIHSVAGAALTRCRTAALLERTAVLLHHAAAFIH